MSNFSILTNFSSFKILIFIFGLKYLNPYAANITQKLPFQNEYSTIISSTIVGIGLFIVLDIFAKIAQLISSPSNQLNSIRKELKKIAQYSFLLIISQFIFTGLLCFLVYQDINDPFLKQWGVTVSLGISIILIYHYQRIKIRTQKTRIE